MSGVTSVSTVASTKAPGRSSRLPPVRSVAPLDTASSTCSSRLSAAASDESGPKPLDCVERVARGERAHRRGELLDEVVVELVDDDHPLRAVARLAGVAHATADRGLHRGAEVVGVEQDEGVGAAELEDDLLEVAPCHLGDGGAGPLGAGDRDADHARVGDDVGRLLVGGEEVDVGVGRQAGVGEDRVDREGRLGALRGVLEQDRVADHQVGRGEAGHLVVGEVPRHDPEQRADRLLAHHRAAAHGRVERGVGEQAGPWSA